MAGSVALLLSTAAYRPVCVIIMKHLRGRVMLYESQAGKALLRRWRHDRRGARRPTSRKRLVGFTSTAPEAGAASHGLRAAWRRLVFEMPIVGVPRVVNAPCACVAFVCNVAVPVRWLALACVKHATANLDPDGALTGRLWGARPALLH